MTNPERLPSFMEEAPSKKESVSDTKRMIELLEAIDWKLWQLYNMVKKGEVGVEQKVQSLNEQPEKTKLEKL